MVTETANGVAASGNMERIPYTNGEQSAVSDKLDTKTGWLSPDQLENIRANVPLVYVDAVPVRVNSLGRVTHIG